MIIMAMAGGTAITIDSGGATCPKMKARGGSPLALRCLKSALNADCDGQAGLQELAGNATLLFYMTEEGQEGRNAYQQGRSPDFSKYPKRP